MTKYLVSAIVAFALLFTVACGPTYVVQPNGQQAQMVDPNYNPGYNPDQMLFDTALTVALMNGQRGYYDSYHHWYPVMSLGGVDGYYDGSHHFHTSAVNKTIVVNHYHSDLEAHKVPVVNGKPDYTTKSGQGSIGRGQSQAPAVQQAPAANQKPDYTTKTGQGTIGRGQSQTQAPAANVKPDYTTKSGQGSIGRGQSSPPSARPSYSSPSKPSGSIGRSRK